MLAPTAIPTFQPIFQPRAKMLLTGLTLADPLMSLIDTACVGQVSAVQLAALGPNTFIFNFVFQVRAQKAPWAGQVLLGPGIC